MKNTVKFSTLMIVMLIAVLSSLVLVVLAFSTARADMQVANKYASSVQEAYKLEGQGQSWLAETDQALVSGENPAMETIIGDEEERHLEIALEANNGSYTITKWSLKPRSIQKQGLSNLFKGE